MGGACYLDLILIFISDVELTLATLLIFSNAIKLLWPIVGGKVRPCRGSFCIHVVVNYPNSAVWLVDARDLGSARGWKDYTRCGQLTRERRCL